MIWLFLEGSELSQWAGVGGAVGHEVALEADAFEAERLDGASRRSFSRPSSDEVAFGRLWGCFEVCGAFGVDFLTEGSVFRIHGSGSSADAEFETRLS